MHNELDSSDHPETRAVEATFSADDAGAVACATPAQGPAPPLTAALLAWYAAQRRDLPWRRTTDPYRIWVSEIMLQQTQVATVIPYYERFLARFPTVDALARAPLDEVLALWQGLGYYARARSLHAAARMVRTMHAGVIPNTVSDLRALPGVGDYTAGAVLSIAYGQDVPAIDGNVVRVLCRLFDFDRDPDKASGRRMMRRNAESLLLPGRAGELNQALMELGAIICLPRAPHCEPCPLAVFCRARALGVQELRPLPVRRAPVPQREAMAALIQREARLLIVRRLPQGLLGGLWELPTGEFIPGEKHFEALSRLLGQHLSLRAEVTDQVAVVHHAYTHFRLTVYLCRCIAHGDPTPSGPWNAFHWLAPDELGTYGLTGVATKILSRLHWLQNG